MRESMRSILIFSLMAVFVSVTWSAEAKPGGQGKLKNFIGFDHCFKPNSGTVYEVCADYTVNWKMWSLMGEPVGDYNLAWKLTQIKFMDPKRKLIDSYSPNQLPNELKKGVSAIELYIDGSADVNVNSTVLAQHHFNTGVAVKSGKGSSINVPESPSWDKLFERSRAGCNYLAFANPTYVDAKTSKEIFAGGITLSGLSLCSKSGVSELSTLESAIGKLCEKSGADKKYQFCPKQEEKPKKEKKEAEIETKKPPKEYTSNIWDELDDKGAEPEIQKRLKELRDAYRNKANRLCDAELKKINTCYTTSNCQPKSENETQVCYENICDTKPSETQCAKYESIKQDSSNSERDYSNGRGYLILPTPRACIEIKSNPLFEIWQSCTEKASQCRIDQTCIDKCNPHNYATVDQCVEKSMQNGPTTEDAKKLVREGWKKKATQPKPSSTQPTNFLD